MNIIAVDHQKRHQKCNPFSFKDNFEDDYGLRLSKRTSVNITNTPSQFSNKRNLFYLQKSNNIPVLKLLNVRNFRDSEI